MLVGRTKITDEKFIERLRKQMVKHNRSFNYISKEAIKDWVIKQELKG